MQPVPQLAPVGDAATVPLPVPLVATVRFSLAANVAVTLVAAVIATVHVPVPLHPPPDQPANDEPAAGDAVSMTTVPYG